MSSFTQALVRLQAETSAVHRYTMASELVWIAYPLAAALVVFYGIVALLLTFYRQNKQGHRDTTGAAPCICCHAV